VAIVEKELLFDNFIYNGDDSRFFAVSGGLDSTAINLRGFRWRFSFFICSDVTKRESIKNLIISPKVGKPSSLPSYKTILLTTYSI
jgi:hypothetical protein